MGYGEVGGGGSVLWHVVHGGDPGVAAGRDPRPASAENGRFAVWINGQLIGTFPIDHGNPRQIQIVWSPHTEADRDNLAAAVQAAQSALEPARVPPQGGK
jgi:hypothetical protein